MSGIEDDQGERWLIASHEFGHLFAGAAMGFPRLGPATCIPGARLTGCAFGLPMPVELAQVEQALAHIFNPYVLLPPGIVERLNHTAVWLMAGQIAEDLLAGPQSAPELIVGRVGDLPEPTDPELAQMAAAVDEALPDETDDSKLDYLARVAFQQDTASAAHWRSLMDEQTHELLDPNVDRLKFYSQVLCEEGSMSAEAVQELLQDGP